MWLIIHEIGVLSNRENVFLALCLQPKHVVWIFLCSEGPNFFRLAGHVETSPKKVF